MAEEDVYFKQLELGPMQNFVYLVGDPASRTAAVVDPGWEAEKILNTAAQDGYRLTKVFLTHTHFDHVMALPDILKTVKVPVYIHRDEISYIKPTSPNLQAVSGGEKISIGSVSVSLIHTPGHSPGSQCLLVGDYLLSGDTLFIKACGRWDLPGGDPRALYRSLSHTLKSLGDELILCPGHKYSEASTIRLGEEKRTNPFMNVETLERFLHLIGQC